MTIAAAPVATNPVGEPVFFPQSEAAAPSSIFDLLLAAETGTMAPETVLPPANIAPATPAVPTSFFWPLADDVQSDDMGSDDPVAPSSTQPETESDPAETSDAALQAQTLAPAPAAPPAVPQGGTDDSGSSQIEAGTNSQSVPDAVLVNPAAIVPPPAQSTASGTTSVSASAKAGTAAASPAEPSSAQAQSAAPGAGPPPSAGTEHEAANTGESTLDAETPEVTAATPAQSKPAEGKPAEQAAASEASPGETPAAPAPPSAQATPSATNAAAVLAASAVSSANNTLRDASGNAPVHLGLRTVAGRADGIENMDGLALRIVAKSAAGDSNFQIRLDPPELGRIDVHLKLDAQGNAQADLSADKPQTLDLLQRDAGQLERALKDAGLTLPGGLSFSLKGDGRSNAWRDAQGHARGRNMEIGAVEAASSNTQPLAAAYPQAYGAGGPRLDIVV